MNTNYSICVIVKNEQLFIREWVEHNFNIGFNTIYIYEDFGSESHKPQLHDYISEGKVVLTPISEIPEATVWRSTGKFIQFELFQYFLNKCKCGEIKTDWCAFIDVDEFIVFDEGWNLEKLCKEYEKYGGVMLCWLMYGANGHIKRPEGKVTEAYTSHMPKDFKFEGQKWEHKSLVNISKSTGCIDNHTFEGCVFTNKTKVYNSSCYDRAHINHYYTKSWEDYCDRMENRGNMGNNRRCYDAFFDCSPEMKPVEKILLNERRANCSCTDTMYISHRYGYIKGGNLRKFRPNKVKTPNLYNKYKFEFPRVGDIADGISAFMVSKCASSTISMLAIKHKNLHLFNKDVNFEYLNFGDYDDSLWKEIDEKVLYKYEETNKNKIIAVYRDPIKRLLSAKTTIAPNTPLEEYLKYVILTYASLQVNEIDKHIAPQSIQYDPSCVDLFIDIKDLKHYLASIGLEDVAVNRTSKKVKESYDIDTINKYLPILEKLYANDYKMIASIPEHKKFKPQIEKTNS